MCRRKTRQGAVVFGRFYGSGVDHVYVGTESAEQFEHHRCDRLFFIRADGIDDRCDQFIKGCLNDDDRARWSPAVHAGLLMSAHLFLLEYENNQRQSQTDNSKDIPVSENVIICYKSKLLYIPYADSAVGEIKPAG